MLNRKDLTIYYFDEKAIKKAKENFKNAIHGSGTQTNIQNDMYDWAISIHTLKHIEKEERVNFISELIRISKESVYINFPKSYYAEQLCKNFLNALEKK